MATIPTYEPLQRRDRSQLQPVVSTPKLADTGKPIRDVMGEYIQARDEDEYAKARSQLLVLNEEQRNAYNDDPDFNTIPGRYQSAMAEGVAGLAQGITNPDLRERFTSEAEVDVARGMTHVADLAARRYKDSERAGLNEEIDRLSRANDDPATLYTTVRGRLNAAAKLNLISQQESQEIGEKFRSTIAVNRIKAMDDPMQRKEALLSPWAQYLQPHIVKQLNDEADKEIRLGKSQKIARDALDRGVSRVSLMREMQDRNSDPELIADTVAQFNAYRQMDDADKADTAEEAFTMYADAIRFGAVTDVKQVFGNQIDLWQRMDERQKSALEAMVANNAAGNVRKYSDRPTILRLMSLKKQGPEAHDALRLFFARNVDKLAPKDFDKWSEMVIGKEPEGLFDAKFRVDIATQNMSDADRADIAGSIDSWYLRETNRLGRPPADSDVNKTIDEYVNKRVYSKGILWDSRARPSQIDPEDRVDVALAAPNADERDRFIRLYSEPEQSAIRVGIYKREKPDSWNIIKEHFIDTVLPPGTEQQLTSDQIEMLIRKHESDPTWPPR